jgi:hypothetical protein
MPLWLRTTGFLGSIAVLIALVIVFFKQLIALIALIMSFIGIITFAIKAMIIFAFLALFIGVGVVVFRSWQQRQDRKSKS